MIVLCLAAPLAFGDPTSKPSDQDSATGAGRCKAELESATHFFQVGIKKHEPGRKGGDPNLAAARASFTHAVGIGEKEGVASTDPRLYAAALGRDAWFKAKIDVEVSEGESELRHAIEIDGNNAILHTKLAWILTDKHAKSHGAAEDDRQAALDEVKIATNLDPKMPEPYYLLTKLNAGHVSEQELADVCRQFGERTDNINPELFVYDDALIKGVVMSVQGYANFFPTTQKSEAPAK
jgi:hypothetical protein